MKVLIQGKIDLFESGGGDKVQIENTAKHLKQMGVEVDVIPGFKVDYNKYDLVHIFQLDWTPETYLYARNAKKHQKPLVLSPIHHAIKDVKRFDDEYTFDFRRFSKVIFNDQFKRDTLKNIYKTVFDTRKAHPTLFSIFNGLKKMQVNTLKMSDVVLVQTEKEAEDLIETYGVDINWKKVINGVGEPFLNFNEHSNYENPLGINDYIICVGRIEARKNQLKIIEAVELFRKNHGVDAKLVFVGRKSKIKHFEYVYRFEKKLKQHPWVTYVNQVPYEKMPNLYKHAKVCVSASWFETTGLTSLEALFCGTNSVASGDRAKEYLGKNVSYCEPHDVKSIHDAISYEYFAPRPQNLDAEFKQYTWENAAKETLNVYQKLLI